MKVATIKPKNWLLLVQFLFYIFSFSHIFTLCASDEEKSLPKREVSLRVYHLFVDVSDALKKQDNGREEIEYISCSVNQGCIWIRCPKTETIPHFLRLVSQGTERKFENTLHEHWLYDIPSTANSTGQHFAIAFGQGEFFETEQNEQDGKKSRVINREYGEVDFGKKIVENIEKLTTSNECLEGRPFDGLCREIKGDDFCSIKIGISSVKELISWCEHLWEYHYQGGSCQIYQTLIDEAKKMGKKLKDVSLLFTGQEVEEEGQYKSGTVQAVRVFGKYYTFEGIEDYIERTKQEVQQLIQDDCLSLPDFDAEELQGSIRDGEEKGDEVAPRKKRKKGEERVDWEGRYNKKVASEKGYLLLDKKCVFSNQIEVCDLLVMQPKRMLVHVKRGTDSASLNHLFGQGYASADLLSHPGSSKIMLDLTRQEVNERMASVMKKRLQQLENLWGEFEGWRTTNELPLTEKEHDVLKKAARFPENKREFAGFCKALGKFSNDQKAKEISEQLNRYRIDLIEMHLNDCWKMLESSISAENITEVFSHLKETYRKKYDKGNGIFSAQDLGDVLESGEMQNFMERVREGLMLTLDQQVQEGVPDFNVVFGIITDKKATDGNVLPLGARINLLRTVQDLTDKTRKVKFEVSLKMIKEK